MYNIKVNTAQTFFCETLFGFSALFEQSQNQELTPNTFGLPNEARQKRKEEKGPSLHSANIDMEENHTTTTHISGWVNSDREKRERKMKAIDRKNEHIIQ